jgi:hypothetical protein
LVVPLFLVFLFPLAVYLLVLASINRRDKPLMVSGTWDALGLVFALAGVYLWIGPAILGTLYERGMLPGSANLTNRRFAQIWSYYPYIWGTYYLLVLVGQASMVMSRRNKTSVYNADSAALERLVLDCLGQRGFETSASGGMVFFKGVPATAIVAEGQPPPTAVTGAVEFERFAALRHVTLHWFVKEPWVRKELEVDIERRIEEASVVDNPSAVWLLTISGILFGFVILGSLFSVLTTIYAYR